MLIAVSLDLVSHVKYDLMSSAPLPLLETIGEAKSILNQELANLQQTLNNAHLHLGGNTKVWIKVGAECRVAILKHFPF